MSEAGKACPPAPEIGFGRPTNILVFAVSVRNLSITCKTGVFQHHRWFLRHFAQIQQTLSV